MMHWGWRTRSLCHEPAEIAVEALRPDVRVPLAVEDVDGVLHALRVGVLHFLSRPLLTVLLDEVAARDVPAGFVSLDTLCESLAVKPFVINSEETASLRTNVGSVFRQKYNLSGPSSV